MEDFDSGFSGCDDEEEEVSGFGERRRARSSVRRAALRACWARRAAFNLRVSYSWVRRDWIDSGVEDEVPSNGRGMFCVTVS